MPNWGSAEEVLAHLAKLKARDEAAQKNLKRNARPSSDLTREGVMLRGSHCVTPHNCHATAKAAPVFLPNFASPRRVNDRAEQYWDGHILLRGLRQK